MKIIQKGILGLLGPQYYIYHLGIINPFLPVELTPKEREVLGTFMNFKGEEAKTDRFAGIFRKKVKALLNLSDGGLSNHISALKTKGAIIKDEHGNFQISELLLPEENMQCYQFKIVKENEAK